MSTPDFRVSRGNRSTVQATLQDDNGAVNLAGCTVQFIFQLVPPSCGVSFAKSATVQNAGSGIVQYTFAAGETDVPGLYQSQWQVTDGSGNTRTFPTASLDDDDAQGRYLLFEVVDTLPLAFDPTITSIPDTYEAIRAIVGDFNPQFRKYEDEALKAVVRTCLRTGKLLSATLPYALTANGMGIAPVMTNPRDFGLLVYSAAKMLVIPDAGEYSYRTRALSERFGEQKLFIQDLENALFDMENGDMFSTFQNFYGWVNALTGMNIWSMMTDMQTRAPVATVIIGRAGIQVNTT